MNADRPFEMLGNHKRIDEGLGIGEIYITEAPPNAVLRLRGYHWRVTAVRLRAFTDDRDELADEIIRNPIRMDLERTDGDIFYLENTEHDCAIFISSEAPDYVTSSIEIKNGALTVSNEGYGITIGYTAAARDIYALMKRSYREKMQSKIPVTMSNTWGDRNGFSRINDGFMRREIEAAAKIGIDVVQTDDGWQNGSTADLSLRDERGRRFFPDFFWQINEERFPGGVAPLAALAASHGIKSGLWFAPDTANDYALLERDTEVLRRAYSDFGIRFFKLDMCFIENRTTAEKFLSLLSSIRAFGDDVSVQLDVTRGSRVNYLFGAEHGTVFVENRYTKTKCYYPHRTLFNLWTLAKYLPPARFQFEITNPDLNTENYEGDSFAPALYGMDYLFASVMLSSPLFWTELQFLSEERLSELKPIMKIFREYKAIFAEADITPIGDAPSGRSHTGFMIDCGDEVYLLLFRENSPETEHSFVLPALAGKRLTRLAGTADAAVCGDAVRFSADAPRSFGLYRYE